MYIYIINLMSWKMVAENILWTDNDNTPTWILIRETKGKWLEETLDIISEKFHDWDWNIFTVTYVLWKCFTYNDISLVRSHPLLKDVKNAYVLLVMILKLHKDTTSPPQQKRDLILSIFTEVQTLPSQSYSPTYHTVSNIMKQYWVSVSTIIDTKPGDKKESIETKAQWITMLPKQRDTVTIGIEKFNKLEENEKTTLALKKLLKSCRYYNSIERIDFPLSIVDEDILFTMIHLLIWDISIEANKKTALFKNLLNTYKNVPYEGDTFKAEFQQYLNRNIFPSKIRHILEEKKWFSDWNFSNWNTRNTRQRPPEISPDLWEKLIRWELTSKMIWHPVWKRIKRKKWTGWIWFWKV